MWELTDILAITRETKVFLGFLSARCGAARKGGIDGQTLTDIQADQWQYSIPSASWLYIIGVSFPGWSEQPFLSERSFSGEQFWGEPFRFSSVCSWPLGLPAFLVSSLSTWDQLFRTRVLSSWDRLLDTGGVHEDLHFILYIISSITSSILVVFFYSY